jgi:hypothetical protein
MRTYVNEINFWPTSHCEDGNRCSAGQELHYHSWNRNFISFFRRIEVTSVLNHTFQHIQSYISVFTIICLSTFWFSKLFFSSFSSLKRSLYEFQSNATLVWIFYSVTATCFGLMTIFRRKYIPDLVHATGCKQPTLRLYEFVVLIRIFPDLRILSRKISV